MLERYIDMVIGDDPKLKGLDPAQINAVREVKKAVRMSHPSVARVQQRCEQEVTKKQYDCAVDAANPDLWEGCIQ
jgi:hypothetical protein